VRHLFCVTEPDNAVAARFAYVKAHAVGMEMPRSRGREKHVLEAIKSVAADARKNGHESFALGVTNTSRAVNAMAAGVRYLEGRQSIPRSQTALRLHPRARRSVRVENRVMRWSSWFILFRTTMPTDPARWRHSGIATASGR
jgi:hypothetical protein